MALPYDQLTRRGRGQRQLGLARAVLDDSYRMANARVRVLSVHSFNTMYRVDLADGTRLVLRVGDPCRIHTTGVEDVEADWLKHLAAHTDLVAPQPVPTIDGSWWIQATHPDVPGERICSLFTWLGGRPVIDKLDKPSMRAVGRTLALLHESVATDGTVPDPPDPLRANRTIYFHEVDLVATHESSFGSMFVDATARVQETLDRLWANPPHRPHLLHGDLGPHNVMRWRNRFQPIDFQDLQFGFDVQDLGISLADISRHLPGLEAPFREGYTDVRSLPDGLDDLLPTFGAARSLNVMNLGLHQQRPGISDRLDRHADIVTAWMTD